MESVVNMCQKNPLFSHQVCRSISLTESFIGDYFWRLMESDKMRTEAGKKTDTAGVYISFISLLK